VISPLPHARSCVARLYGLDADGATDLTRPVDHPALLIALQDDERSQYHERGVVILDDGRMFSVPLRDVTVKFPPQGDDRLLLGWSTKGGR
jgi:hypothetical protein